MTTLTKDAAQARLDDTDLKGLLPMPGQLYAIPKAAIAERVGAIYIPETARRNPGYRATVVAENPRQGTASGYVGRDVIFHSGVGQTFEWHCRYEGNEYEELKRYPLSQSVMVAVCYDGVWAPIKSEVMGSSVVALPAETGIHRCRYCKARGGQGNIILDGNGVCPNCGREADGRKHLNFKHVMNRGTAQEETITMDVAPDSYDEEIAGMLGTPKAKKAKGTIFSYDKQGRRS